MTRSFSAKFALDVMQTHTHTNTCTTYTHTLQSIWNTPGWQLINLMKKNRMFMQVHARSFFLFFIFNSWDSDIISIYKSTEMPFSGEISGEIVILSVIWIKGTSKLKGKIKCKNDLLPSIERQPHSKSKLLKYWWEFSVRVMWVCTVSHILLGHLLRSLKHRSDKPDLIPPPLA